MALDTLAVHNQSPAAAGGAVHSLFSRSRPAAAPFRRVALVGTFAPRKCGIATFTTDMFEKLARFHPGVARRRLRARRSAQPARVRRRRRHHRSHNDPEAYARAARRINESGVDAVWLQHEYGIFGGARRRDGVRLRRPPRRAADPHPAHRADRPVATASAQILEHLVARASRIMVMSRHSRDLLAERYGAPARDPAVIAHGAPDRPFGRQDAFKAQLGLTGSNVLMTFGLLGPGKGLEHVIEALPAIVARHPEPSTASSAPPIPTWSPRRARAIAKGCRQLRRDAGRRATTSSGTTASSIPTNCSTSSRRATSTSRPIPTSSSRPRARSAMPWRWARRWSRRLISTPANCSPTVSACWSSPAARRRSPTAVNRLLDDPAGARRDAAARLCQAAAQTIWPRFADGAAALIEAAVPRRPADRAR